MTELRINTADPDQADRNEPPASTALTLRLVDSLAAAEPLWRALEDTAVLTPYQRFDWLATLAEQDGPARRGRIVFAFVMRGDAPAALLPLAIRRRFGLHVATLFGAELGGAAWMPVCRNAAPLLDRSTIEALLAELREAAGPLDVLVLTSQPGSWLGLDNPLLALPHQPGPDHFYRGAVGAGPGSKRLRNVLRGKRRLEESFGPVSLRSADTPEAIAHVHAVFLEQRGKRFAEQGIDNFFAADWVAGLFRNAARRGLAVSPPPLRLHALYAGDEILATSCGTYCGTHYSQYINSTTDGPAAKSSLMGLLMHELSAEFAAQGIATLDMGIGDFDYKLDWTAPETVYDAVVPLSPQGRLLAALLSGKRRLKRAIKQNRQLFGLLKGLRARLRGGVRPVSKG